MRVQIGGEFMFFIFNRPKIYSYLIVLSTVVVLFFTAAVLSEANNMETLTTSSTIEDTNMPINKVETEQKKIDRKSTRLNSSH